MNAMGALLSVEDAQRKILERLEPLDAERVPIERAAGRVLAAEAVSSVDLPPFPSSAMDGFALRAADTDAAPLDLPVVARIAAGSPATRPLSAGEAMAISTGGVVPDGADSVVPIEHVEVADSRITVREAISAGLNVRPRGGDVHAGTVVLDPGTRLGAAQVGALAAAGIAEVRCTKRPRAGILVTGSELRRPGDELGPGQIYESNGLLLAAALHSAGAVPAQLGVASDDPEELERALERALLGFDMLVTSGGASVGPHDLVRATQERLRAEEVFWRVAIKPGKPVAFSMRRKHPIFNLPGNPVSVLVTFELFVRPAVEALLGVPDPLPRFLRGRLARSLRRNRERDEFVRARTRHGDEEPELEPLDGQESHMIAAAGRADALIAIGAGDGEIAAGESVHYLRLA